MSTTLSELPNPVKRDLGVASGARNSEESAQLRDVRVGKDLLRSIYRPAIRPELNVKLKNGLM